MDLTQLLLYTSWSTFISAVATIITLLAAYLFFSIGQPFGTISDVSSVIQVVFMIPIALTVYRFLPDTTRTIGLLAAGVGVLGMLVIAIVQGMLVFGWITFEDSLKFFPAAITIGLWLLITCSFAIGGLLWPRGLAWAGILGGCGYILAAIGFLLGGRQNKFFYTGYLLLLVSYPIWGIWLGCLLVTGMWPV